MKHKTILLELKKLSDGTKTAVQIIIVDKMAIANFKDKYLCKKMYEQDKKAGKNVLLDTRHERNVLTEVFPDKTMDEIYDIIVARLRKEEIKFKTK